MKINFNINYLYSLITVETLIKLGVKDVCLSPGSRNTPLSMAFANAKKINKYLILDERSSAFFALGVAKASGNPVAIVTTSGTAVGELYPAIIEAFNSRIPLIILTADRPLKLYNTGANQTINQVNIFSNHIRFFKDVNVNTASLQKLRTLKKNVIKAFFVSLRTDRGPVHLNFHFEKPLEPFSENCRIDDAELHEILKVSTGDTINNGKYNIESLINIFNAHKKILFYSGGGEFNENFKNKLLKLSSYLNIPILADAQSPIKLRPNEHTFLNAPSFLGALKALELMKFDLILQFGSPPTTQRVLNYFKDCKAKKISVNKYGDLQDPSATTSQILKAEPNIILDSLWVNRKKILKKEAGFFNKIVELEKISESFKIKFLEDQSIKFEGRIVFELMNILPDNSNIFISNSMPIRDLDYFAPRLNKKLNLFYNRGASGIDGIVSTALGISATSNKRTILLTGDLAFLYDLNALQTAKKFNLNLLIILINNNGGGIFRLLPIAKEKVHFEDSFIASHNFNFKKLAAAYNSYFRTAGNKKTFARLFDEALNLRGIRIIEIKTDSRESTETRKKYWKKLEAELEERL